MKPVLSTPAKPWLDLAPPARRSLISLTPLIDVVFILLVFFMLAASFHDWRAIDLGAPAKTASQKPPSLEKSVLIEVRANDLRVSGETVSLQGLKAKLSPLLSNSKAPRIFIRPDRGVALQQAVRVLDLLSEIGATKVSMIRGRERNP